MVEILGVGIVGKYLVCCYSAYDWNPQAGYAGRPGIPRYACLYKDCRLRDNFEDIDIDEIHYLVEAVDLYDCVGCHLKSR